MHQPVRCCSASASRPTHELDSDLSAAQVIGSLAAAGVLKALLPNGPDGESLDSRSNLGANSVPHEQTIGIAFLGAHTP